MCIYGLLLVHQHVPYCSCCHHYYVLLLLSWTLSLFTVITICCNIHCLAVCLSRLTNLIPVHWLAEVEGTELKLCRTSMCKLGFGCLLASAHGEMFMATNAVNHMANVLEAGADTAVADRKKLSTAACMQYAATQVLPCLNGCECYKDHCMFA